MKLQKHKILISLLPASIVVVAVLFAFFNFAQAVGPSNEVIGQVTLDGLPADGATVVLTDINSTAFLTDTVGATGSSSISGYYYFDLSNLSTAPTDGDEINIDVSINSLIAKTSFIFDSSIATVTPAVILLKTDVTAPVITLNGSSTIDVIQNTIFIDPGAIATDDVDGDITANIIATGTVDTAIVSQYIITYDVSDVANNTATSVIRTVNVIPDTVPPVITLIGSSTISISQNSTFSDSGATALDNVDGDISANIIASGTVDSAVLGQYIITYSATDVASNTASTTRTINVVPDVIAPVISLIGSSTLNISLNSVFSDPGATAIDDVDGNVTANIVATGTVDTAILGQYILTYSVIDVASNTASITRNVNVVLDTVPPVIKLTGSANVNIAYSGTYTEQGAIWTDDVDGTGGAIVGGQAVDTNLAGTYIVTYNYTDSSGNEATQVNRTVVVESRRSSGGGGGSILVQDNTSPGIPTNIRITYIENQGYKLTWVNPSDSDFSGIRIIRKIGSAPTSVEDETRVFENRTTSFIDVSALSGVSYYYGLASYDNSGNFSNLVVLNVNDPSLIKVLGFSYYIYQQYKDLYGLPSSLVEEISSAEAQLIFDNNLKIVLTPANQKLFDNILMNKPTLSESQKNVLANFIQSGSPTTIRLGSGERTGVLASFANAFGTLPSSIGDYQEVVKIANGRWTKDQSFESENKAKEFFKQVYKRSANTASANDNNAIKIMAYGLRPINRNLNSERTAIAIAKDVYKHNPVSTSDWDIMRAIAYSGAKR